MASGIRYCSGMIVCSTQLLVPLLCESDAAAAVGVSSVSSLGIKVPTALLSHSHPLSFGQLHHCHPKDVHELAVGLLEYCLEKPGM